MWLILVGVWSLWALSVELEGRPAQDTEIPGTLPELDRTLILMELRNLGLDEEDPAVKYDIAGRYNERGDYEGGVVWHRAAAEQGHAGAQCALGGHLLVGLGVPENYAEAYFWLINSIGAAAAIAGTEEYESCFRFRDEARELLSASEIILIQRRAAAWWQTR